jgi:hypothetical protein
MPCPDLGALRASLDDVPGAIPAPLHGHVQGCPSCSETLAELQRNAELAAPAIAMTAPPEAPSRAAVAAALDQLQQRRARLAAARTASESAPAGAGDTPAAVAPPRPRRRGRLAGLGTRARAVAAALVATLVLTGLVATPGGRAAAAGFLSQFRSQRFQVLSLDARQSNQLGDVVAALVETGVFSGDAMAFDGMGEPLVADDLAEASRVAGFPVQPVGPSVLPRGVEETAQRIMVTRAQVARITFDRDQALAYFRDHGRADVQVPERFDGTQLVIEVPAVVVQQFAGRDGGPRLLVGKAGMLTLDTEGGASLEELRELVLGLPGLPQETVEQLRAIGDWRTTLPLPVPSDEVRWRPATVDGAEGLGFEDPTGKLHALLWQRGGHIWGVAGVIGSDEALDVASSLG